MEVFSDLDTGWVWWSTIGGGDVRFLWDLQAAIGGHPDIDSGHDDVWPLWLDFVQRNEAGFMPIPTIGPIRQMKPLGGGVMVYAHDAVGFLRPVSDPVPTMSWVPLMSIGCGTFAQCAAGDDFEHVFQTKGNSFYRINAQDLVPQRIGGEELGAAIAGFPHNFTTHFDPVHREAYFIDGTPTQIVIVGPDNQFTTVRDEIPTSITRVARTGTADDAQPIVAITDAPGGGVDTEAIFESEIIDMGTRQVKTVHRIEIDGEVGLTVILKVRHDSTSALASHTLTLDGDGIAVAELSGVDFVVRLTKADFSGVEIDNVTLVYDGSSRVDVKAIVNA